MRTDVSLDSPERKLVIEAKYYREPMQNRFGKDSVRSATSTSSSRTSRTWSGQTPQASFSIRAPRETGNHKSTLTAWTHEM
jgi:hypothetical protein